ncbi:MAG: phage Gp37/Gp68 family protein [Defluviitaleaceae bacterium]|nr:phage Gp37/Gp68 family protein [Defluviitaleaceae bacterium]
MNKTDIDWCDRTWNPITGCYHDCEYCYADEFQRRYRGCLHEGHRANGCCYNPHGRPGELILQPGDEAYIHPLADKNYPIFDLEEPLPFKTEKGEITKAPYPFGFIPTLHRYRLRKPTTIKTPQNVFVGSMADGFGSWVPDEWIEQVFRACEAAPQHRYLFLTKNAQRYDCLSYLLAKGKKHGNWWFGVSATNQDSFDKQADGLDFYAQPCNAFVSLEPLHGPIELDGLGNPHGIRWVIVGAETGRNPITTPKPEWVYAIVDACKAAGVPVFLKDNLQKYVRAEYIDAHKQCPWKV